MVPHWRSIIRLAPTGPDTPVHPGDYIVMSAFPTQVEVEGEGGSRRRRWKSKEKVEVEGEGGSRRRLGWI
ncbi:hypothetical protein BDV98DRAFT_578251 [Pterulicium gracile]|uniref:Uncharacterized protein n=1 Tax=Pterulicium gracile TaxID=1884261 RepID=A0A5C3PZS5_9AGAR|nr:hypothetical protein BDV98DRAFT_578251 [Pterula gracilis]